MDALDQRMEGGFPSPKEPKEGMPPWWDEETKTLDRLYGAAPQNGKHALEWLTNRLIKAHELRKERGGG